MKKRVFLSFASLSLAALLFASSCVFASSAAGSESYGAATEASGSTNVPQVNPYKLEPNVTYDVDLDGDGTTEPLSYLSYTNEGEDSEGMYYSNAVLDLFIDKDPFWSITDEEWTYNWKVFGFELADGKTYLLALSVSDNDWTNQALVLTKDPGTNEMHILTDLTPLTRSEDAITDNKLGSWSRATALNAASGQDFTVNWMIAAMSTGNISLSITYSITDEGVVLKDSPISLTEIKEWTSWRDFDVQASPEDSAAAFHVSPEEKVTLTEFCVSDNHYYLKCQNEQGQEGWICDPDEIYSEHPEGSDLYLMGYFKEALFAG